MAETFNDPPVGHKIDKDEFLKMTRAYRDERLSLIAKYGNNQKDSRSCFYAKETFETMLQTDCTGLRIYYGVRTEPSDGKQYTTLVLAAVKKNAATGVEEVVKIMNGLEEEEVFYDWGSLCPPDPGCDLNPLLSEIDSDI